MSDIQRYDLPEVLPIHNILDESSNTKTIVFDLPEKLVENIKPGEYFMLWLPGVDEKPISVSRVANGLVYFTICSVGSTTETLINCRKGDLIGLRGPYGNSFSIRDDKTIKLIIAGGMGIAPLRFLIDFLLSNKKNQRIVLIHGARTVDGLYFRKELNTLPIEVLYCTDDGSHGYHGYPTVIMEKLMKEKEFYSKKIFIYSCGPEVMLKNVLSICKDNGLETCTEISLADRHVRCGFGICGSCFIDDSGLSLCNDGPVFRGEMMLKTIDFGKYGRNADGSKFRL